MLPSMGKWPLCTRYFGTKSFDDFVATFVAFFTPSIGGLDPAGWMQMIAFLRSVEGVKIMRLVSGLEVFDWLHF